MGLRGFQFARGLGRRSALAKKRDSLRVHRVERLHFRNRFLWRFCSFHRRTCSDRAWGNVLFPRLAESAERLPQQEHAVPSPFLAPIGGLCWNDSGKLDLGAAGRKPGLAHAFLPVWADRDRAGSHFIRLPSRTSPRSSRRSGQRSDGGSCTRGGLAAGEGNFADHLPHSCGLVAHAGICCSQFCGGHFPDVDTYLPGEEIRILAECGRIERHDLYPPGERAGSPRRWVFGGSDVTPFSRRQDGCSSHWPGRRRFVRISSGQNEHCHDPDPEHDAVRHLQRLL